MTPYIIALMLSLGLAYSSQHIKILNFKKKKKESVELFTILQHIKFVNFKKGKKEPIGLFTVFFVGFPLFFISAFRYNVGTDFQSYLRDIILTRHNVEFFIEPFFKIVYRCIIQFNLNEQWLFIITSICIVFPIVWCSFRESPMPTLSLFLFWSTTYFFCSMNGIRQFVAIAILMISLKYVEERKLIKFLICIALAACVHMTSIVFAIVYLLYNVKISPKKAIVISAVLYVLSNPIAELAIILAEYTRYGRYIGSVFDNGQGNSFRFAIQLSILVFSSVFYKDDPKYSLYYKLQVITVWIYAFAGKIVLIRRLAWTFGTPAIILIPMAVMMIKNKSTRYFCVFAICTMFFIYSFLSTIWGIQGCYPYQFVWGG